MISPKFRPCIENGEIASLPSYHFYMLLGAMNPEEPSSGLTTPLGVESYKGGIAEVINSSRKLYAKMITTTSQYAVVKHKEQTYTNQGILP